MEPINNIFKNKPTEKVCKYKWQELAREIIIAIPDTIVLNKQSSVFKCCKRNEFKAKIAFGDCKELNKLNIMYFLKVFNELNKKK